MKRSIKLSQLRYQRRTRTDAHLFPTVGSRVSRWKERRWSSEFVQTGRKGSLRRRYTVEARSRRGGRGARARFLSRGATGSGFTILVTCDLLSPTGQRHCTGSKEVWCHFSDLRLLPRRLRVRGQTGHQHAYEHAAVACTGRGHAHGNPPSPPACLYTCCARTKTLHYGDRRRCCCCWVIASPFSQIFFFQDQPTPKSRESSHVIFNRKAKKRSAGILPSHHLVANGQPFVSLSLSLSSFTRFTN